MASGWLGLQLSAGLAPAVPAHSVAAAPFAGGAETLPLGNLHALPSAVVAPFAAPAHPLFPSVRVLGAAA